MAAIKVHLHRASKIKWVLNQSKSVIASVYANAGCKRCLKLSVTRKQEQVISKDARTSDVTGAECFLLNDLIPITATS